MNYKFENIYTKADAIKWKFQAADMFGPNSTSLMPAYLVFVVQFALWTPIFYFVSTFDIPFTVKAVLLFVSFVVIGVLYDMLILPHVTAHFDKDARANKSEKSCAIIEINDEEIRTRENEQEIIFKWTGVRSVEDNEKTVFLLTDTGYCLIPSRCFSGFLAKDAFVRACREKISGQTEQGAYFA